MRPTLRHTALPDRRAARLVALTTATANAGPIAPEVASPGSEADGLAALARVLAAYGAERLAGRGERREADAALRAAVRCLAASARAQDPVRAERLLLAVKPVWRALPPHQNSAEADARAALWPRLVALCVEEFYAPSHDAAAPAPALFRAPAAQAPARSATA